MSPYTSLGNYELSSCAFLVNCSEVIVPQHIDDESTLVQVMTWGRQATAHCLNQCIYVALWRHWVTMRWNTKLLPPNCWFIVILAAFNRNLPSTESSSRKSPLPGKHRWHIVVNISRKNNLLEKASHPITADNKRILLIQRYQFWTDDRWTTFHEIITKKKPRYGSYNNLSVKLEAFCWAFQEHIHMKQFE